MVVVLPLRHVSAYCPLLEASLRWRVYLDPSCWEKQDLIHLCSAMPTSEYTMRSRSSWGGRTPPNQCEEGVQGVALLAQCGSPLSCCAPAVGCWDRRCGREMGELKRVEGK